MSRSISEDIFVLIKSLTIYEKRYFRFYATMGKLKENLVYLKLFYAIDGQKKYNEKKILKKVSSIKPEHLSSKKNYLRGLILESLQWYHSSRSVNARLWSLLSQIEVLYNKGLHKECIRQIKKAKELARHFDSQHLLSQILIWEGRVLNNTISGEVESKMLEQIFNENISAVEKIRIESEYLPLINKLFSIHRDKGVLSPKEMTSKLREFIPHPLLRAKKTPASYYGRYYNFSLLSIYNYLRNDFEKSYLYQKKIVENFEMYPQQIDNSPDLYCSALGNFLSSSVQLRNESEIENSFNKISRMMQNPVCLNNKRAVIFLHLGYNWMVSYYNIIGEFKKGGMLIKQMDRLFADFINYFDKSTVLVIYYNYAHCYFLAGNYKQAIFWLNKIINDKDSTIRIDIQTIARLLNLIAHFELGNLEVLTYLIKSVYRFLLKSNRLNKIELIVIEFMHKKITRINSMDELPGLFKQLKSAIERVANEPVEQQILERFDFISWLESKIEKRPFAEIVKEREGINEKNT